MRTLASIVTIEKCWNLEGKDRVQGCSFVENSYEAMIGKDLNEGDLAVFIQEGAILPVEPRWEFLRKRCFRNDVNGFLIKPQKFSSIKSWGLTVSLKDAGLEGYKQGDDVTEILKIRKFEPKEDASPKSEIKYSPFINFCFKYKLFRWIALIWKNFNKTTFHDFPTNIISKSDETSVQNLKGILEKFANEKVYVTAKMEGQSFTALCEYKNKKAKKFYVCSRNKAYKKVDKSIFWKVAKSLDVETKLKNHFKETGQCLVLQGEQVGPEIQSNVYNLKENAWFIFTIKDQVTGKQLSVFEAEKICKKFEIPFVPIVCKNVLLKDIMPDVKNAESFAEKLFWKPANYLYNPSKDEKLWQDYLQHEGVVVRTMNYDKDLGIGCSFKVKNLEYQEKSLKKIFEIASTLP